MIHVNGGPVTADATGASAFALGDAAEGVTSMWVVQVIVSGTLTALKFKGLVNGSGLTVAAAGVDLAYRNRTSDAVTAGGTGITASGIYEVGASGLDVYVDVDVGAGGSIEIYAEPVVVG